jgi:nucleoside-diphosphate-sugar epimerase
LITGATGLVGRWIRRIWELDDSDDILVPCSRSDSDLLAADNFARLIDDVRPATVVHLAWSAGSVPGYRQSVDNDRWAAVTLEASRRCEGIGARLVALGTVLDDRRATDAYTRSKQNLRRALDPGIASGTVTWLRPFYVFDPEAGRPSVLRIAAAAQREGRIVELRDPSARHDFVHAADVARAIITSVRERLQGTIDIGSGRTHTVAQLMTSAGFSWTQMNVPGAVAHDERAADTSILLATGWEPIATDRFFEGDPRLDHD